MRMPGIDLAFFSLRVGSGAVFCALSYKIISGVVDMDGFGLFSVFLLHVTHECHMIPISFYIWFYVGIRA